MNALQNCASGVCFGYRDFDPLTAMFTAKDPLGYAAGDSDLRGYCFDDPVNGVDPEGLFEVTKGDVIGLGTTLAVEGAKQAKILSPGVAVGMKGITAPLGVDLTKALQR